MQPPLILQVRQRLRPYIMALGGFSLAANLLLLVAPLYMLQVYDRVLSSGSHDTLIWLTLLAVFLLGIYGAAEAGRRRVCSLAGAELEDLLARRVFTRFEQSSDGAGVLGRDLAAIGRVRGALQAGSVLPFVDLPFAPIFLLVLFLVHPLIGALGLVGGALVFGIAFAAEMTTRQSSQISQSALRQASDFAAGLERQRSAMVAMGLVPAAFQRWRAQQEMGQGLSMDAAKADGKFTAISRSTRQILQICVLGGGAALALAQEISPGAIVAASIILARTLGPIDQIVGGWRNSVQAWSSWKQLRAHLDDVEADTGFTPLPRPDAKLVLDRLSVTIPGAEHPLIRPFSWQVEGGQLVAVAGGNGAGKTTLLQTLSGAWPAGSGVVRLGGRAMHEWAAADRGRYVGYVPQDVMLFAGSVRDNILIGSPRASDADMLKAARLAGVEQFVNLHPMGFDMPVGERGQALSGGQKQAIAIARALLHEPNMLIMDEPSNSMDNATEEQFKRQLTQVIEGRTLLMVTHKMSLLSLVDRLIVVDQGQIVADGPKDTVLEALKQGRLQVRR